ncbi:MAG TPA: hypothetical protein VHR45_02230 [Thermoanaerobaculia bacterium]|nr:hypothetical protein [Thermoanaerobaculia bacterium]
MRRVHRADPEGQWSRAAAHPQSANPPADRPGPLRARLAATALAAALASRCLCAGLPPAAGPPAPTRGEWAVSVQVEDRDTGEAVSGAAIELSAPIPFAAAGPCHPLAQGPVAAAGFSGEEGGAVLPVPHPGLWRLIIRAPGRVPAEAFVAVTSAEETVPVAVLDSSEEWKVQLLDAAGHPLARAAIVAATGELPMTERFPWSDPVLLGESAAGGGWSLPYGPRNWRVGANLAGYQPSSDLMPHHMRLRPAAPRLLRLLDPLGGPLAGARLWDAASCVPLGTTDGGGEVALAPALARGDGRSQHRASRPRDRQRRRGPLHAGAPPSG